MIIGIDASRANRDHKSGTEWYSYYLIRALARIDDRNTYILYSDRPLVGGLADLTSEEPGKPAVQFGSDGFQKLTSPYNNFKGKVLGWPWRFFWSQGRLSLEMLIRRPDILFVPAHALPIIHPKRSAVTVHDIGFHHDRRLYEEAQIGAESKRRHGIINGLVRLLTLGRFGANSLDYLEWSTRYALRKARRIISISEFTRQELRTAYGVSGSSIAVVHNGYNDQLYRPLEDEAAAAEALERYGIRPPYIFYVGRLEKKKNTATLIEAFALLKERHPELSHKLYLIGDASYGFDDIKYTIHGFGLEDDVISTGWVAEEDLPYIFAKADAFVFPSNYEGFGIPLLQAMATRTPIVASNAASIPEVVGEAGLLFDPKSPAEMAEAMARVLTDETVREQLVTAGQERVRDFSWERCARETLAVLEAL